MRTSQQTIIHFIYTRNTTTITSYLLKRNEQHAIDSTFHVGVLIGVCINVIHLLIINHLLICINQYCTITNEY